MSRQELEYIIRVRAEEAGSIEKTVQNIKNSFNNIKLSPNLNKSFLTLFSDLETKLNDFKTKVSNFSLNNNKGIVNQKDFNQINKLSKEIVNLYTRLGIEINNLPSLDINKLIPNSSKLTKASKAVEAYFNKLEKAQKNYNEKSQKIEINNQKNVVSETEYKLKEKELREYTEKLKELEQQEKEIKASAESRGQKATDGRTKEYKQLQELTQKYKDLRNAIKSTEEFLNTNTTENRTQKLAEGAAKALIEVNALKDGFKNLSVESENESIKQLALSLKELGIDPSTITSAEELKTKLNELSNAGREQLKNAFQDISNQFKDGEVSLQQFASQMGLAEDQIQSLVDRQRDVEQFTNRLKYFFSINNTVQLFKRAVRSAIDTVKELDEAMTEIATVSDFSIGDMWEKLPEFTQQANELGVAINDTYKATTLYIQQGLDLQKSMALSNETLKMARISGMEAADATDAMTAALRGFNMELNETSGERINDVYSKIAAITAADTQEIATAMSKTASIAAGANMEFETTTALLAQIIETTR